MFTVREKTVRGQIAITVLRLFQTVVWAKEKGHFPYLFLELESEGFLTNLKCEKKKGVMDDAKVFGQNNYKVIVLLSTELWKTGNVASLGKKYTESIN